MTTTPFRFKDRDHYTAQGEAKRPLTVIQAQQICLDNPALDWYTCSVCRKLHVGNRRKEPRRAC